MAPNPDAAPVPEVREDNIHEYGFIPGVPGIIEPAPPLPAEVPTAGDGDPVPADPPSAGTRAKNPKKVEEI